MFFFLLRASLLAQVLTNLPVTQETQVQSVSCEDPLEKGMATHSSILAWKIPWTEEPGGLQSMGLQSETQLTVHARARAHTHTHTHTEFTRNFCIGLQMFISYVNNR